MKIFKEPGSLNVYLNTQRLTEGKIGFVPTMGALHKGHLSLIHHSVQSAHTTVCSIFINPLQFNNTEDFIKYPKTIENDIMLLEQSGCDILFMPDEKEVYPDKASRIRHYDLGYPETVLEGKFRPGHFQGVCLVVERLLNIVNPDFLFLGQKDFQQCIIVKRLIQLMNKNIELIICPIVREENGLAMSSRNLRLSRSEKETAAALHQYLVWIKEKLGTNNFKDLQKKAISSLEKMGFKIDYLELANRNTLEPVDAFKEGEEAIVLIAVFLNGVRLIDNQLIN